MLILRELRLPRGIGNWSHFLKEQETSENEQVSITSALRRRQKGWGNPTCKDHSNILPKWRKYAKKCSKTKFSSNMERPWRPNSLIPDFKVCFSFSSYLDSIKPWGKVATAWRSCASIYSHPQNNICPFNDYYKPFERIISGKFWSRVEWFPKISQGAVNHSGLAGSWLYLHIWFNILFLPNGILGTLWN